MVVQCLIDLGTCLLVADLARRLFGRRAGLVVLWLAALCPFTANYVAAPLTETLSLLCIALAFYGIGAMESGRCRVEPLAVGDCDGAGVCACLLRPEQGLLAACGCSRDAVGGYCAMRQPELRRCRFLCFAALSAWYCRWLPWTVRNWKTFHVFEPLAPRYATDPGEPIPGVSALVRSWGIEFASTEQVYWNWDSDDDRYRRRADTRLRYGGAVQPHSNTSCNL